MNQTVALETLGCKVNQYESSYFQEILLKAGYQPVSFRERADCYIVHSCAVTNKAAFQTRQLLRRAQRINPQAKIVVVGCDAQLESDRLAEEGLATHILGTAEKMDLLRWLEVPGSLSDPCRAVSDSRSYGDLKPLWITRMLSDRSRAFLKLQDGCNSFCSYCVVPYTRGRSRSLVPEEVFRQMEGLTASGYQEIVLTGIHLGQWGRDLDPAVELTDLLESLAKGPLPPRIRLSSLESAEWSERLLERLPHWSRICPHFHVPLQSGDETILKLMRRPYTPRQYAELIRELRRLFPQAALGADILIGFPGETEHHFRNTLELVRDLPLTYFHVFPFSPRPGTRAADMPGRVTGDELKRRTQALRELGFQKRHAFRERFIGQWVEVLVEGEDKPGWWKGTSENYLQVLLPSPHPLVPGTLVRVRLTQVTPSGMVAR